MKILQNLIRKISILTAQKNVVVFYFSFERLNNKALFSLTIKCGVCEF